MLERDFNKPYRNRPEDEYSQIQHSVHYKRKERFVRKKHKKINRIKSFCRLATFLGVIYITYKLLLLSGWYLPADTFSNPAGNRVEIVNNKIVPTFVLRDSLKEVKPSKLPIFMASVKPVKKALYMHPTMKKIYVRRYAFPARMQIIIKERTPIAIIKTDLNNQPAAFFTSDGVFIRNKKYMNLSEYSSVLNILTTPHSLKKEITADKIHEIEEIVGYVETYSKQKVEYIDMRKPNDVYVKIQTTSIRLGALDSTVEERIKRIYTILPQISDIDSKVKYIDLSWDKVNYLKLQK